MTVSSRPNSLADLKEEFNSLLLRLLASNPVTAGFFEIIQHIANPALKTQGRRQVDGDSLLQCLDVLSAGTMRSLRPGSIRV